MAVPAHAHEADAARRPERRRTRGRRAPVTFLTQEAYDRLAAELEHLSTTGREEIAQRIESAREEGDLKENGGYHAAKDEQGKQEARIRTLQHLLKTATVSEAPAATASSSPAPS